MSERARVSIALWLILCSALAYLPQLGHGFIDSDFDWLVRGDVRSLSDIWGLVAGEVRGHYRPVVAASFALNHGVTGPSPLGHGLMNLAVAGGVAAAVGALAVFCRLGATGAMIAATVWAFHPDTMGPATIVIAGRGVLLGTLGAALAAIAATRGRRAQAGGWTLLALLSHESMWPVPLMIAAWAAVDCWRDGRRPGDAAASVWHRSWPTFAALGVGLGLRAAATGALAAPLEVARGAAGLAYAAAVAGLALALPAIAFRSGVGDAGGGEPAPRYGSRRTNLAGGLSEDERRAILKGGLWLAPGVVSALARLSVGWDIDPDASAPALGLALLAGGGGRALTRLLSSAWRKPALAAALLIPLAMVPAVWAGNSRLTAEARLSSAVLMRIFTVLRERDDLQRVELYQSADESPSIRHALGDGLPAALQLGTGRHLAAAIHLSTPSDPWPAPQARTLRLTVAGDEMIAVTPPQ